MSRTCTHCGAELSDESVFCPACGQPYLHTEPDPGITTVAEPVAADESVPTTAAYGTPAAGAVAGAGGGKKPLKPGVIAAIAGGAVVLLALIGLGIWLLLRGVAVPDLEGKSIDQAERALIRAGLELGDVDYDRNADGEPGRVVDQDPASGERLKKGSEVDITVAGGEPVEVPDLVGLALDDAESELLYAGLELGGVTEEFSDEVPYGMVIGQSPAAGDELPAGSAVDVVVSYGPEVSEVPDVVGETEDDAIRILEDAGFTWDIELTDDDAPEGTVIEQYPAAGADAEPGDLVSLSVSTGVAMVEVPSWNEFRAAGDPEDYADFGEFLMASEQAIEDGFEAVGLVANIEWAPWEEGVESYQDPEAGTMVPEGTVVYMKLYVAD